MSTAVPALPRPITPPPPRALLQVLGSLPRDLLEDLTRTLKARSSWLSCEEQREYKRAKLLNIITGPADGSPPWGHRLGGSGSGGSPGGGMLGGGGVVAGLCSPRRADADAFCRQVLLGGCEASAGGSSGGQSASAGLFEFAAGSEAQLAGLEMRSEGEGEEGQHCMQGATTPFTPFDAPRTKMRLLPLQQQGQGQGLQLAAGAACSSAAEARLAVAAAAAAEPSSTGGKSGECMGSPGCGCVALGGCGGLPCAACCLRARCLALPLNAHCPPLAACRHAAGHLASAGRPGCRRRDCPPNQSHIARRQRRAGRDAGAGRPAAASVGPGQRRRRRRQGAPDDAAAGQALTVT